MFYNVTYPIVPVQTYTDQMTLLMYLPYNMLVLKYTIVTR